MGLTVITLLTTAGVSTGPFDLYSDVDSFTTPFETNISRSAMLAGYVSNFVPNGTTVIRIQSVGFCTSYFDAPLSLVPTLTPTVSITPTVTPTETPMSGVTPTPTISVTPTVTPSPTPVCDCPSGFTRTEDFSECYMVVTVAPTVTNSQMPGYLSPNLGYGNGGFIIYDDYNTDGTAIGPYAYNGIDFGPNSGLSDTHFFWSNRLNSNGVWLSGNASYIGDLSFCSTVDIPETKTYYVGIAGDNDVSIKINGTTIVDQPNTSTPDNFQYWHIYPVLLNSGLNVIEMVGTNRGSVGGFAAEIYDNVLTELTGATGTTDVNIIFTTGDFLPARTTSGHTVSCPDGSICTIESVSAGPKFGEGFCSNYSCPDGWFLDTSDPENYVCTYVYIVGCGEPAPTLSPTPTPSNVTPTPTPTITVTPTISVTPTYNIEFINDSSDVV